LGGGREGRREGGWVGGRAEEGLALVTALLLFRVMRKEGLREGGRDGLLVLLGLVRRRRRGRRRKGGRRREGGREGEEGGRKGGRERRLSIASMHDEEEEEEEEGEGKSKGRRM